MARPNEAVLVSTNPATGEALGRVPVTPASDLDYVRSNLSVDSGRLPVAWWHPYDDRLRAGFAAMIDALYAPNAAHRVRALAGNRPEWRGLIQRVREMGRGAL